MCGGDGDQYILVWLNVSESLCWLEAEREQVCS